MLVYLVRRTLLSLMVFVLAAFVCFLVIQLFPGDYYTPLELYAPQLGLTQEFVDQLRTAHGLDKPMIVQFGLWLGRAFTGDFGYSVRLRAPVRTVIFRRGGELQNSAIVSGTAMLLAFGVGIPLGMLFANHRLRGIYYAFSLFTFPLLALPASYLGLLIQWAVYRWIDPMMVGPGMYGMCTKVRRSIDDIVQTRKLSRPSWARVATRRSSGFRHSDPHPSIQRDGTAVDGICRGGACQGPIPAAGPRPPCAAKRHQSRPQHGRLGPAIDHRGRDPRRSVLRNSVVRVSHAPRCPFARPITSYRLHPLLHSASCWRLPGNRRLAGVGRPAHSL